MEGLALTVLTAVYGSSYSLRAYATFVVLACSGLTRSRRHGQFQVLGVPQVVRRPASQGVAHADQTRCQVPRPCRARCRS